MTSIQTLANSIPLSFWVPIATGTVIPYLSALASKKPGPWTGVATALLSVASAFLVNLLANGTAHFDWRLALVAAVGTWLASTKWHDKVAKDGPLLAAAYHALGGTNVWDVSTLPPARPVGLAPAGNQLSEAAVGAVAPSDEDGPRGKHEAPEA